MTSLRLSLLLACAPLLHADFDKTAWRFRRPLPGTTAGKMLRVKPDAALYRGSQNQLTDIRLLHGNTETPYVIDTLRATGEAQQVTARLLNQEAIPGTGVQLTLEQTTGPHDRVSISTKHHDFRQRVQVETSGDARQWALVLTDGVIYDVSQGPRPAASLSVDYPLSTRRYVRITIFGWDDPKAVLSAWLTHSGQGKDTREAIFVSAQPANPSTGIVLDLGAPGLPQDAVTFEIAPGLFSRSVDIDSGTDGKGWQYAGRGTVFRTADRESLTVTFAEQWNRYLRVRIVNGDDQPLSVRKVSVEGVVRYIRFLSQPGDYWLYYGNAAARQPSYDTTALNSEAAPEQAALGPEQPNPDYREKPKPFSDRNPFLLYATLTLAIVAMGYVTVRFLLKVTNPPNNT